MLEKHPWCRNQWQTNLRCSVVDRDAVLFMQAASRDHTETEEEGETKCKVQHRESPRVSGLLV